MDGLIRRSASRRAGNRPPATGARAVRIAQSMPTARLALRRPRRSDAAALAASMNDWEVVRWLVQAPFPYTLNHAVDWIAQNLRNLSSGREYQFVICHGEDQSVIGHVGLRLDDDRCSAELGYWLDRSVWGQGYATEAAATVAKFGFAELQLERIWATCLPDNIPSARVLIKLGMRHAGTLAQTFEPIGKTVTCPVLVVERDGFVETGFMESGFIQTGAADS